MRLAAIALFFVLIQCDTEKKGPNYKYYNGIAFRESPFADHKGIIQIDKKEASGIFHYKFEYDSENRLQKISQMIGDRNAVYQIDHNAFFIKSSVLDFSYYDDTVLVEYKDRFNKPFSTENGVSYERFVVNEDGFPTELTYLNEVMEPVNNKWEIATYRWRINPQFVEELRFDVSGKLKPMRPDLQFYKVRPFYDEQGFITKFSNHNDEGELINSDNGMAYDLIGYNNLGNFISWQAFDKDGNAVINKSNGIASGKNFEDENGRIHRTEYYDDSGNLTISNYGYSSFENIFDEMNNLVGWFLFDERGEIITQPNSQIVTGINEFDNVKRRKGYHFVNINRESVDHPEYKFASVLYKYDQNDNLIEEKFVNTEGSLVFFEPRGAAKIEYVYSDSELIATYLFNENEERIDQ